MINMCAHRTLHCQGEMHTGSVVSCSMAELKKAAKQNKASAKPEMDAYVQGQRLQKARIDRGIRTAKEACRRFNRNYNSYAQNENGTRGLTKNTAPKYAKAYGVSAAWLLTGEHDDSEQSNIESISQSETSDDVRPSGDLPREFVFRVAQGYGEELGLGPDFADRFVGICDDLAKHPDDDAGTDRIISLEAVLLKRQRIG